MDVREIFTILFVSLGILLFGFSALGVVRLPDFFSRLHAGGIGETLGMASLSIGLIIATGFTITSLKIFLVTLSIFVMNPVGTNLICKAALESGHRPLEKDEEGQD